MLPMQNLAQRALMMDRIPRRILLARLPLLALLLLHLGQMRQLALRREVGLDVGGAVLVLRCDGRLGDAEGRCWGLLC